MPRRAPVRTDADGPPGVGTPDGPPLRRPLVAPGCPLGDAVRRLAPVARLAGLDLRRVDPGVGQAAGQLGRLAQLLLGLARGLRDGWRHRAGRRSRAGRVAELLLRLVDDLLTLGKRDRRRR